MFSPFTQPDRRIPQEFPASISRAMKDVFFRSCLILHLLPANIFFYFNGFNLLCASYHRPPAVSRKFHSTVLRFGDKMRSWAKAVGAGLGYVVGGPIGAVFGYIAGKKLGPEFKPMEGHLLVANILGFTASLLRTRSRLEKA